MSAEATFWAWSMGVGSSSAKLVLLCLADCHNSDTERCDPSAPFICQFTGLDKKTVPAALQWLAGVGLISVHQRAGSSSQYTLHIDRFPAPLRKKGERRPTLSIRTPPKNGVTPKTGRPKLDPTRKRGDPKNGETRISPDTPPKNGGRVPPKTGHEPTSNLQEGTYNSSDPDGSASQLAKPVDNSFQALGNDYQSPSAEKLIFDRGTWFLGQHGIDDQAARSFLGMLKNDPRVGPGRTLDAILVSLISQPAKDPKGFILGVVANQPKPMEAAWQPEATQVGELEGLGVPMGLIRNARDIFVTWFHEQEISHSNWPRLFKDWVIRDWEAAECQAHQYRTRLAESAGLNYQRPFQEAP